MATIRKLIPTDDMSRLSDEYAELLRPGRGPAPAFVRKGWDDLARHAVEAAAMLSAAYNIRVTDDPEPYPDAPAMFADLREGRFVVSISNCEHPIWTPSENIDFRIVHDIMGHYVTGGHFDFAGEVRACSAHAVGLPSFEAKVALMTECMGQTAYAIDRGYFAEQVIGTTPGLIEHTLTYWT